MIELVPVRTAEQVEWLRVQRNRPELYKYFRQDKPISEKEQAAWWASLSKGSVALFIVEDERRRRLGYAGFNPINRYASAAEFGIFIVPEFQGCGYGKAAMSALLRYGFENLHLSTIYSDVMRYDGEDRLKFYLDMGFAAYPESSQGIRYMKQGLWVPATKFYMTMSMWLESDAAEDKGQLEPVAAEAIARPRRKRRRRGRPCLRTG